MVLAGRVLAKLGAAYDVRSRDTRIDEKINRSIWRIVFDQRRGIMKLCRLAQLARLKRARTLPRAPSHRDRAPFGVVRSSLISQARDPATVSP
ncbi:hypothetical protein MLAC_00710 [Mycobacterium lacus]|uniref:Transposase n=1 Tax=Mycobacterium lacus TaxID=169765 RepID=A0A7I7NH04_9MYCO|nr:hypothetical protein MLAC_00710 [Mycobacterium lacus]